MLKFEKKIKKNNTKPNGGERSKGNERADDKTRHRFKKVIEKIEYNWIFFLSNQKVLEAQYNFRWEPKKICLEYLYRPVSIYFIVIIVFIAIIIALKNGRLKWFFFSQFSLKNHFNLSAK